MPHRPTADQGEARLSVIDEGHKLGSAEDRLGKIGGIGVGHLQAHRLALLGVAEQQGWGIGAEGAPALAPIAGGLPLVAVPPAALAIGIGSALNRRQGLSDGGHAADGKRGRPLIHRPGRWCGCRRWRGSWCWR